LFHKNSEEISSGYFGKLPEFNDFIKFNAGSPEIQFIDNWLQEGLSRAKLKFKSKWKLNYENLPPTFFYIPVPSSEKNVAGMLYAGRDKSGREFPFVIFSLFSGKVFNKFYLIPAELEQTLFTLDAILRKEEDIPSLNTALKNNITVIPSEDSISAGFNRYLLNTNINEFLARTGLDNSIFNLDNLTYTDSSFLRISFTSDKEHFCFDAGYLIGIYEKKINLAGEHSSVFWNNNDDRFQMKIFPFKLTATGFIDLLSLDINDNRVINIKSSSEDPEAGEENKLSKFSENNFSLQETLKFF
jgi:type VI secretion system ImpM family protein